MIADPELPGPVPTRGGTLLRTEAAALLPLLRGLSTDAFDSPTVLPGWSVRDVLAHCAAALTLAAAGTGHTFTPEDNERDVAARRSWSHEQVLAELESGYQACAGVVDAAGGRLDGLALGVWIHGGDVREALRLPSAYAGAGIEDAVVLLADRSRARGVPATDVELPGAGGAPALRLGPTDVPAVARLRADVATLFRLVAGRRPDPARYTLAGARAEDYLLFR